MGSTKAVHEEAESPRLAKPGADRGAKRDRAAELHPAPDARGGKLLKGIRSLAKIRFRSRTAAQLPQNCSPDAPLDAAYAVLMLRMPL